VNTKQVSQWKWQTLAIISAVSLKSTHLETPDLAKNSSISRIPMLYPLKNKQKVKG